MPYWSNQSKRIRPPYGVQPPEATTCMAVVHEPRLMAMLPKFSVIKLWVEANSLVLGRQGVHGRLRSRMLVQYLTLFGVMLDILTFQNASVKAVLSRRPDEMLGTTVDFRIPGRLSCYLCRQLRPQYVVLQPCTAYIPAISVFGVRKVGFPFETQVPSAADRNPTSWIPVSWVARRIRLTGRSCRKPLRLSPLYFLHDNRGCGGRLIRSTWTQLIRSRKHHQ